MNVKFNVNKLQYCVNSVEYLGHKISEKGILPSDERIEAVKSLGYPKNKRELQKFLGFINYVISLVPNMAHKTAPLTTLLTKDTIYEWLKVHSDTVDKIKEILMSPEVLKPFNDKKAIVIQI